MIAFLLVCCLFACVGCSSNCRAGGASGAGRTDAGCDDEGGAPLVDVDACVGQHVCVVGDIVVLSSGGGGTRCLSSCLSVSMMWCLLCLLLWISSCLFARMWCVVVVDIWWWCCCLCCCPYRYHCRCRCCFCCC